jgi:hypothetical protein
MRRQWRDGAEPPAFGMSHVDRTRVQMQTILELAQALGFLAAIFEVADNGRSQMRQMGTQADGSGRLLGASATQAY